MKLRCFPSSEAWMCTVRSEWLKKNSISFLIPTPTLSSLLSNWEALFYTLWAEPEAQTDNTPQHQGAGSGPKHWAPAGAPNGVLHFELETRISTSLSISGLAPYSISPFLSRENGKEFTRAQPCTVYNLCGINPLRHSWNQHWRTDASAEWPGESRWQSQSPFRVITNDVCNYKLPLGFRSYPTFPA